jgi:hypothetical protein
MTAYEPKAVQTLLWRRGELEWKLRPYQKNIYKAIRNHQGLKYVVNAARRIGKSYLTEIMAIEDALASQNAIVRLIAPSIKMLKNITLPLFRHITEDAPWDVRPVWKASESKFFLPITNSEILLSGANNGHEDDARGTSCNSAYIDEAGFVDNLTYLVEDVLIPQLLTTKGKLILMSTAPRSPSHDFAGYANKAEQEGNYSRHTIYEAGFDERLLAMFRTEAGGENSTTWKREYLCQFVVDENYAIIPEWKDHFIQEPDRDRYFDFYHRYVAVDIGVRDFTAVLFGYYDFKRTTLFVEDEVVMNGPSMTTDLLAKAIRAKETELWGDRKVMCRIGDNNNLLLLQDLSLMHNLPIAPTAKDMLEAMVNHTRLYVNAGRVIVSPKCKHLIGCLRNGIWNENRREFARSSVYGHFDGLAALIYMIRNVDVHTNPIPVILDITEVDHYISEDLKNQADKPQLEMMGKMLGLRRSEK